MLIKFKYFIFFFSLFFFCLYSEQLTKEWIKKKISLPYYNTHYYSNFNKKTLLPIFTLSYKENNAAAFNFTQSIPEKVRKPFLLIIALFSILYLLYLCIFSYSTHLLRFYSFFVLLLGVFSNFLDRFLLGYVIDFINLNFNFFYLLNINVPTFNISDIFILIGFFLIFFHSLFFL